MEKDKTKIFSEFYQVNRERDEAMGGTGIGLALTRRLVVLHGGEIGVESELHKGSCFWFTLPLDKEVGEKQGKSNSTPIHKPLTAHHILVVEDNDDNLALTLDMISVQNHKVSVARNGKEAIEVALSQHPELILMDIRMPVMNGLEAVQRLRKLPQISQIPIIAITASEGENSRGKCLEAGFSEYITKPINSEDFFGMLTRFLK